MLPIIIEIIGIFLFTLTPIILKKYDINILLKTFLSTFVVAISSLIVIYFYDEKYTLDYNIAKIFTNKTSLIIGILQTIYYFSLYYGLYLLPVSIGIPLFMLSPIIMTIMDKFVNGIEINMGQIIGFIISFIGIILVVFSKSHTSFRQIVIGSIFIIICVLCYAYVFTQMKKIVPEEEKKYLINSLNIQLLNYTFIPVLIYFISIIVIYIFNPKNIQIPNIGIIMQLIVIFFFLAYVSNNFYFYAYNNLSISTYGAIRNVGIIISMILGFFLLNEEMTIRKIIGSVIIIIGILVEIYFRKHYSQFLNLI